METLNTLEDPFFNPSRMTLHFEWNPTFKKSSVFFFDFCQAPFKQKPNIGSFLLRAVSRAKKITPMISANSESYAGRGRKTKLILMAIPIHMVLLFEPPEWKKGAAAEAISQRSGPDPSHGVGNKSQPKFRFKPIRKTAKCINVGRLCTGI